MGEAAWRAAAQNGCNPKTMVLLLLPASEAGVSAFEVERAVQPSDRESSRGGSFA
jgi:hypothetical protein